MSFVDFYKELNISETASLEEVKASIKENRRRYRALTGSPNLDQRSLAEHKMAVLAKADEVFSSEESKAAYDSQLAANRANQPSEASAAGSFANDGVEAFLDKARFARQEGSLLVAIKMVKKAIECDSNNIEALKLLGSIALDNKDYALAEEAGMKAFYLNRQDDDICDILGQVYSKDGRYNLAIKQFDRAYELSQNPFYLVRKAEVFESMNQYSEAGNLYLQVANNDLVKNPDGSIKESKFYGEKAICWAMDAYGHAGDIAKVMTLGESLIAFNASYENLVGYHDALPSRLPRKFELLKEIFNNYGQTELHVQGIYANELFLKKMEAYMDEDGRWYCDTKEKVQALKAYLDEIGVSHLTDSSALNFVAEKQAFYDKMSKKVINNGGCMMWGITLLLAYLTWKNLSTNFVLAIFFGLALYGYIRLFVYVPYWKKQSK